MKNIINNNKREIDEMAVKAKDDEIALEKLISLEMAYIRSCAGKTLMRHIEARSEEEMIAIEAFVESVQSYSYEKGNFLSFAKMVMGRRLIDWIRIENKRSNIIPLDPNELIINKDEKDFKNSLLNINSESYITEEIENLKSILMEYGFSFYDLTKVSPKAIKTKTACKEVINYIINNKILVEELRNKKTIPIKTIEKNTKVPRKIIDRHRKYIIAVVEIKLGDYPNLSHYVKEM